MMKMKYQYQTQTRTKEQLIADVQTTLDDIYARDAAMRRYRRRHPIKYWRWLRSPEGQRWRLTFETLEGKTQHIIW